MPRQDLAPQHATAHDELPRIERERQALIAQHFPLHGLVTGLQLKVRMQADPDARVLGWLRMGSRLHVAGAPTRTPSCPSGWHRLFPDGWVCAGQGVEIAGTPPASKLALNPPPQDAALPYTYYLVKDDWVPEYHRPPTPNEHEAVAAFLAHYAQLRLQDEKLAARMWRGELPKAPTSPAVVRGYLRRGYFVAGAGSEERHEHRYVRTVRGSYVQDTFLSDRQASSFHGVELNDQQRLPLTWVVRAARPFHVRVREDGTLAYVADEDAPAIPRYTQLTGDKRARFGDQLLHQLEDGRYLKSWFVAVAEQIAPPPGIAEDEPWVHVNIEQQTLVLYRGATPVFATLVSSGLPEHETPEGLFTIRSKLTSDTMANMGPDAGEDGYRIEDVPWTQYFRGSLALHGAFWHDRFGLKRSHGCVNLSPTDARRVFAHTWPRVEVGWHGLSTDRTGQPGSKVLITH